MSKPEQGHVSVIEESETFSTLNCECGFKLQGYFSREDLLSEYKKHLVPNTYLNSVSK